MSLSSLDHDTLLQDKIRLDSEIRCMTESLVRLQQENDKLSNKNIASAEGIAAREARITEEVERNETEIEILQQERGLMQDTFAHEQLAIEAEVQRYQHAAERYHELLQENEQLRKSTLDVLEEISELVMSNETELHTVNKQQLQFRLKLEDDLRKKLVEVERKQQDDSFSSLPYRAKEMLFDNAKLKDEISLQAVGIRSIDMRAARERMEMRQIQKRVQQLRAQSEELRTDITDAAATKLAHQQRIAELKAAREDLQNREEVLELHSTEENMRETIAQRIREYTTILSERNDEIMMWSRRISSLDEMMRRLRITRAYSSASRGRSLFSAKLPVPRTTSEQRPLSDPQSLSTFSYVSSTSSVPRAGSVPGKDLGIHSDFSQDRELSPIVRSVRRFSMTASELGTQPKSQLVSTVQQVLELWEETQSGERVYHDIPSTNEGELGAFLQRYRYLKSFRNSIDRSLRSRSNGEQSRGNHSVASKSSTDWKLRLKRSLGSTSSVSFGSSVHSEVTQHPLLASPTALQAPSPDKTVQLDRVKFQK